MSNREIDYEISLLHREIINCAHCASLKAQIVNLMNIRMPDSIQIKRDLYSELLRKDIQKL